MFRSHLLSVALLASFILPSHGASYKYWVDSTCSNRPNWNDILSEALNMAKRSAERLASSTDTDYHNVFQRIFKTSTSDTTNYNLKILQGKPYDLVHDVLNGIGNDWSSTDDRLGSDVRFYCNNGARWKDFEQKAGYFLDEDNMLITKADCDDETYGFTAWRRLQISSKSPQQNPNRNTIDLCDLAFNAPDPRLPKRLPQLPNDFDLTRLGTGVKVWRGLTSLTIVHEMTHARPYDINDHDAPDNSYGWDNVMAKNTQNSLDNADNYVYFALWAAMADRQLVQQDGTVLQGGYTLPRPSDNQNEENAAKRGLFRMYQDLTRKRWLEIGKRAERRYIA